MASVYSSAITSIASSGNPRSCIIHSSLSWSMVLNAELKSTYSKYKSFLLIFAFGMMFMTFCSCRIVFFCFLKPSCALLKILKCSAYLYKHFAITPVHSLYRVFASAIGLQFPKSCSLPQEHCLRLLPRLGRCFCHPHQDEQLVNDLVHPFW